MTNGGRAVVVVSSSELRGSSPAPDQTPVVADRRVEAFDWPRHGAAPERRPRRSRAERQPEMPTWSRREDRP